MKCISYMIIILFFIWLFSGEVGTKVEAKVQNKWWVFHLGIPLRCTKCSIKNDRSGGLGGPASGWNSIWSNHQREAQVPPRPADGEPVPLVTTRCQHCSWLASHLHSVVARPQYVSVCIVYDHRYRQGLSRTFWVKYRLRTSSGKTQWSMHWRILRTESPQNNYIAMGEIYEAIWDTVIMLPIHCLTWNNDSHLQHTWECVR